MSMSVLSAYAHDRLEEIITDTERRRARITLMALGGFGVLFTVGVMFLTGNLLISFIWGGVFLLLSSLWIGVGTTTKLPKRLLLLGVWALCLVDVLYVDANQFFPHSSEVVLGENSEVFKFVSEEEGVYRVYSPSYSFPQQTAAWYKLELAEGVDPLHLLAYSNYMEEATGVPVPRYSVTVPSFEENGGNPDTANKSYIPDAKMLGKLNVRFVVAEFEVNSPGLQLVSRSGNTYVYENLFVFPRAWVEKPSGEITEVTIVELNPNRVELIASGPGTLYLSEINYPGWRVTVNGNVEHLEGNLLRIVQLDQGEHNIEFQYQPLSVYIGWSVGILALLGLLVYSFLGSDTRQRNTSNENR
jgi:hypothetical protein